MKINKIDRIYESVRKIDQVYETWSTKHGFTLYEMETAIMMHKKFADILLGKIEAGFNN